MRSLVYAMAVPFLATAAWAQTSTTDTSSGQAAQATQGQAKDQAVRQQVQKDLKQEGFTDIKVVPRSFLVSAKDKKGNQVMMFVTPSSVTAVERIPGNNATTGQGTSANQGTQGSSSSKGGEGSSPHASPNGK